MSLSNDLPYICVLHHAFFLANSGRCFSKSLLFLPQPQYAPSEAQLVQIRKAMEFLQVQQNSAESAQAAQAAQSAKTTDDAAKKSFEFWSTQPVPRLDEEITTNEHICPDIPLEKLRREPYSLPNGFKWDTLNIDDPLVVRPFYLASDVLYGV